ncbi:hypothetical protein ACFZDI_11505 [Streptomyces sp. NPDC007907]|uniref:hypothetical protein n=1 Tax=Streptomyces sp. NPDC007907 TaxID=3364789 RepID=UPI0036EE2B8C
MAQAGDPQHEGARSPRHRGLAEYTNLSRFDSYGHYGDNWPLLHVTQAGRDHLAEHREVYEPVCSSKSNAPGPAPSSGGRAQSWRKRPASRSGAWRWQC